MTLLLAVVGGFVYSELRHGLDNTIDRELSARLAGAVAIVADDGDDLGDPVRDPMARVDPGGLVQVLDPDGGVAGATSPQLLARPLVDTSTIEGVSETDDTVEARDIAIPELDDRMRIAMKTSRDDGVDYTVIAGASLGQRDETLGELRQLLWIGGPILLLLTSIAAYLIAAAALRPVETMRERAGWLSATSIGERLPVSPSRDEISRLGETLNRMLDRMEAAFGRERSFVADASHELRTPLAVLRAELDLALDDGRSPAEMSSALSSALEETDRLIALADQLLVLARSDVGGLPLEIERTDLGRLVEAVAERFNGAGPGLIEVATPSPSVIAKTDPVRIEQVLTNLIDNAISHGGGTIKVEIRRVGNLAEIHVLDQGPGFPEELLDSAFDRFVRADSARDRSGDGLGLAIVAAIARSHGGEAGLDNRPGGGADVWISLPLG